jgi:hypothetical protein
MAQPRLADRFLWGLIWRLWYLLIRATGFLFTFAEVLLSAQPSELLIWGPLRRLVILVLIMAQALLDLADCAASVWSSIRGVRGSWGVSSFKTTSSRVPINVSGVAKVLGRDSGLRS